uniref:Erythrocyte membrane protein 1 n=2 Tax=Plasmodium gaboni TaxID=647221 RepID=A0A0N9BHH7_9APIC|nr:erythrocyte membrane protein 1 [Plasmodium gaboni]
MGNTESNEKSSLLKNFQYLTDGQPPHKLLYFDYLNFLHYELQHEAWKWEIYKNYVGVGGVGGSLTENHRFFCGWKQIQEQIFNKLNEQLKGTKTYNWDNDVLPLINIEETKVLGTTPDCKNVTISNNIDEIDNAEFPALSGGTNATCNDLKTSKDIHVPLRRRGLLVDSMYDYLEEIKKEIKDESKLKQLLSGEIKTKTKIGDKAIEMKKEMIEGISDIISNLIKDKHKDKHEAFCKEWYRTMEDYHTLLLGNDIVNENKTKEIQCSIKDIEKKLEGKSIDFKKEWSSHFKTIVHRMQNGEFVNPNTNRPCEIYASDSSQCVRFFEEWAEEFCVLKRDLGKMVVSECGGASGSGSSGNSGKPSANCTNLCNIYTKFMDESKKYYNNYKKICMDRKYGYDKDEKDLLESFKNAAMNSMTDCCTDQGNCKDTDLFDVTKDISNIRYKCFCPEGEYKKQQQTDTNADCQKILNSGSTVTGHAVPATTQPGMSHSVVSSTTQPPNCDEKTRGGCNIYINDDDYAKIKGQQNCCGLLNAAENTRSDRTIKWRNRNDNKYEFLSGRGVPEEVYLPPRKQNLCFKDLDKREFTTTDQLKEQLLKVGATEGYNLGEYYKNKKDNNADKYSYDVSPCNALKYSFLDLRDIILGYDMLEPSKTGTENKMKEIFKKGGKSSGDPGSKERRTFWNDNQECVWKAMLCGYKSGRDQPLENCNTMPSDTTYPIGNDRDSGTKFQFLRWIEEWSEDFCAKRKTLADNVVEKCKECKNASDTYHESKSGGTGKECNTSSDKDCTECKTACSACKNACTAYKNFVSSTTSGGQNNWRDQWKQMNDRYTQLMDEAMEKLKTVLEERQKAAKSSPSASGTGGTSTTTTCSDKKDGNDCAKSFYEYLYDSGNTTLSSYINMVSQNTDCGGDKHVVATNTCGITYI